MVNVTFHVDLFMWRILVYFWPFLYDFGVKSIRFWLICFPYFDADWRSLKS